MSLWFDEYENEPIVEKSKIPWKWTIDFQVQGNFVVNSLRNIRQDLSSLTDEELLKTSQYCFNILSWIKQMEIMGFTGLPVAVDELLTNEFKNPRLLRELQFSSLSLWLKGKAGQYEIGENTFTVQDESIYYRNLYGEWHGVERSSVFHIFPTIHALNDEILIQFLNQDYQPTPLDKIFDAWKYADFDNELPSSFSEYIDGESSPEIYLNRSKQKIADLIKHPIALKEVRNRVQDQAHLEKLIKIAYVMSRYVVELRDTDKFIVYLLRDCLSFYEIHHTFDLVEGRNTSFDQLYIGRNLMTNKKRAGGHWFFTQNALFNAYKEHPDNFDLFYDEYSQILREYEEHSEEFAQFIKDATPYIKNHINQAIQKNQEISIVDLGFQGSINLFIKYVIENHIGYETPIAMNIYVLAEWFKNVYAGMYSSDTYSLLTIIEDLDRNERLFEYKDQSLDDGNITVIMGSEENQKNADIELIINTMVAKIMVQ